MPSSLGAPEILVILVVALIVLGPAKLPEAGRQIGKALSEVRRWSASVQSEIRDVIDADPSPPSSPPTASPPPTASSPPYTPAPPPYTPPPATTPPPPPTASPPTPPSSANGSAVPTPTAAPEVTADPTDASPGGQPPA